MRAFHNDKKIKAKYLNRVLAHQKSDAIIQGIGWNKGKGCAVGCTLENYDHKQYEVELGIPEWLARVEDVIFEGLPEKKAVKWPAKFLSVINVGADLDKIKVPFIICTLKNNLKIVSELKVNKKHKDVISAISLTKAALKQMINAQKSGNATKVQSAAWSARAAARSARAAAWSAAESAAWSAAWSARAAARSAWSAAESAEWSAGAAESARSAAYEQYANHLVKLLKQCK